MALHRDGKCSSSSLNRVYIKVGHSLEHLLAVQNYFFDILFVPLCFTVFDETGER